MSLKTLMWSSVKCLSNLYFSISLLLVLALVSILGTIIEQDQSLAYYKLHYPVGTSTDLSLTWKSIMLYGLNHVYSTYWFLALLFIFFSSLLMCTFSTQLPILKYSRQWRFLYRKESLEAKALFYTLKTSSFTNLIYVLIMNDYFIFHKGGGIYAYKGLPGRISPIFVHFSIIMSFFGFILRMTSGCIVQEIVPSGEMFHWQNLVTAGDFSSISYQTIGKVNDFFITLNDDKSIQQFFSNISLYDNKGNVIFSKYIWVNSPLKYNGLTIYQTDWRINAIRLRLGAQVSVTKPLIVTDSIKSKTTSVWSCDLLLDNYHKISIIIPDLLDTLFIYNSNGTFIASIQYGEWIVLYGVPILFQDLIISTGLQVKMDPGIVISYSGFFVLIFSILFSYISFSQIWGTQALDEISLSGETSRSLLLYEDEMSRINKTMQFLL